ncbi:SIMPL domain-containing protein [Paenibacillus sp. NPDC057967]|uniref:SIMPL domain-containing protein n=1 Tax=Paenibacillus sp. NPDC057967 TaxID=3346293 RepID=UPI0036DEEC19
MTILNRSERGAEKEGCDFTIEVSGEGVTSAAPDRTIITLGVVTEGKEVAPVQRENADAIRAIIEALTALGVPRSNVQTKSYSIDPQYDYEDGKQVFRGYKATHLLQITLDGVEHAGTVLDTATAHGANLVSEVAFASSEAEKHQEEALAQAVRRAQQKAAGIAAALGVSLSAVPCKVQEIGTEGEPIRFKTMMAASDATLIEPGQLTFKAAVRLWYLFA